MKPLFKWFGLTAGIIIVAFVLAAVAITTLMNPNQFKPLIISQFKDYTGYQMTIPGKLSWSFFPHLSVQAEEVEVSNPPAFSAKAKRIDFRIRLAPLLHHQLELSKVSVGELKLNQLQASNLAAKLSVQDNVLQIHPLTADFYNGAVHTDARVSLSQSPPDFHFVGNLKKIQIASLLAGLTGKMQKLQFDGQGDVSFDVTTQGRNTQQIKRQLNGSGKLNLSEGVLKGIDIGFYVNTAIAIINKQQLNGINDTNQTAFGQLTGTTTIKNGVATCNDLVLDSPLYTTHGTGTVDLANRAIDFHLEVTAKPGQKEKLLALYDKNIPIRIIGSIDNPYVGLDTVALMQELGKEQLQKVQEKIQNAIPDKANQFIKQLLHG